MRDASRIKPLLERLAAAWERNPDLRLGQLIYNATRNRDLFNIEDDDLLEVIEEKPRVKIYLQCLCGCGEIYEEQNAE